MLFPVQHSWRCALCILAWCLAYRREHTTISFPVNYPLNYSADWWLLLFVWVWFHGFRVYFLVVWRVLCVFFGFVWVFCPFLRWLCFSQRHNLSQMLSLKALFYLLSPVNAFKVLEVTVCRSLQTSYDIRAHIPGFRLVQSAMDVISKPRTSSHAEAWSHYPWRSLVYFIQEPAG